MQITQHQLTSPDVCAMLSQYQFNCSNPGPTRNHWASFEKDAALKTRQGNTNVFEEFKNIFALKHVGIVWNWF